MFRRVLFGIAKARSRDAWCRRVLFSKGTVLQGQGEVLSGSAERGSARQRQGIV